MYKTIDEEARRKESNVLENKSFDDDYNLEDDYSEEDGTENRDDWDVRAVDRGISFDDGYQTEEDRRREQRQRRRASRVDDEGGSSFRNQRVTKSPARSCSRPESQRRSLMGHSPHRHSPNGGRVSSVPNPEGHCNVEGTARRSQSPDKTTICTASPVLKMVKRLGEAAEDLDRAGYVVADLDVTTMMAWMSFQALLVLVTIVVGVAGAEL